MNQRGDRENRAREALIVSRLRAGSGENPDPEKLPKLTAAEKSGLECLRPGFIATLLKRLEVPSETEILEEPDDCNVRGRELVHGMNRANEITQATDDELNRKRLELIEQMQKERDDRRDCKGG